MKIKELLKTKKNVKIRSRNVYLLINNVYLLIKEHNQICLILKRFNDFRKFYLQFEIFFFTYLFWFLVFEVNIDPNLALFNKIFLNFLLCFLFGIILCLIYFIFIVALEIRKFLKINLMFFIMN